MMISPGDRVLIPLTDVDTDDDTLMVLGERLKERFPRVEFTMLTGCALTVPLVYREAPNGR